MKNAWYLGGTAALLLAGGLSWAVAQDTGGGWAPGQLGGGPGGMGPIRQRIQKFIHGRIGQLIQLRGELGLTGDQKRELRDIFITHRTELSPLVQEVIAKRHALHDQVLAEAPDEAAIRTAADALGDAIADLAVKGSELAAEARFVLTDEQCETLQGFRTDNRKAVDGLIDGLK